MAKSHAFLATIPDLSVEALGKLHSWAQNTSVKSDINMARDGVTSVICFRIETKSIRELQRLSIAFLIKWDVKPPTNMLDWMQLTDPEQYDEANTSGGQDNAELDLPDQAHKERPVDHVEESTEKAFGIGPGTI